MLLACDIGNTNVVFGFYEGVRLAERLRIATDHARTSDETALLVEQFMLVKKIAPVSGFIVATVVPRLEPVFRTLARDYFGLDLLVVSHDIKLNITFDYPRPSEIGADRICNAAAVYDRFGGPAIVVDFGTATTFDVVDQSGAYVGGVIAPGLETAQSALAHRAAQLFKISLEAPRTAIGKTTEEAMKAGFFYGGVGQTDFILGQLRTELAGDPRVVATGGLAEVLAPASRFITEILPDITLDGLRLIYSLNRSGRS